MQLFCLAVLVALGGSLADPNLHAREVPPPPGPNANFMQLVDQVRFNLWDLKGRLDKWDTQGGISSALEIQEHYPDLVKAVNVLQNAAGSVPDKDVAPQQIFDLVHAVGAVLHVMTAKESDFAKIGAKGIIKNDISELQQPVIDIMNGIIKATENDCTKLQQLAPIAKEAGALFTSADPVYNIPVLSFPTAPACKQHKVVMKVQNGNSSTTTMTAHSGKSHFHNSTTSSHHHHHHNSTHGHATSTNLNSNHTRANGTVQASSTRKHDHPKNGNGAATLATFSWGATLAAIAVGALAIL